MNNLKEIMEKYNHIVEFPLLGRTLTVSPERNVYHNLRHKYDTLADDAMKKFKGYLSELKNIDEFFASIQSAFTVSIEDGLNEISRDAISVGCYDLDSATIVNECVNGGYFNAFAEAYQKYENRDNQILSKLSNAAEYRAMRKNSRPRWTSVTYGGDMLSAWGNQFKTGTMNVIEGAGHSIRNAIGNAIDEANAKAERNELFKNQSYRKQLINSVWHCASNLRLVITNIISKKCNLSLGGWISDTDSKRAESMYNNLMKLDLPEAQQKEFILSILELNPYVLNYYIGFLKKFFNHGKEILDIAEFFNLNGLMNHVKDILSDFTKNNLGTTIDDLNNCKELTLKSANALNVGSEYLQPSLEIISKHGEKLLADIARTNLGTTADDLNKCRDLIHKNAEILDAEAHQLVPALKIISTHGEKLLIDFANNNLGTTEDEAYNCRKNVSALAEKMQLDEKSSATALEIVNNQITKLDLEYRTVNGIVLASREEADKAKGDVKTYSDLLGNPGNFKLKSEFLEHIAKVEALPIDSKIKEKHNSEIKEKMEEFDKRCKKALRHEYRKSHGGKPFWNGDTVNMFIQYLIIVILMIRTVSFFTSGETSTGVAGLLITTAVAVFCFVFIPKKEEKIWNELTNNGKYTLSYVTSTKFEKTANPINTSNNSKNNTICPYCGKENCIESKFCIGCGKELKTK